MSRKVLVAGALVCAALVTGVLTLLASGEGDQVEGSGGGSGFEFVDPHPLASQFGVLEEVDAETLESLPAKFREFIDMTADPSGVNKTPPRPISALGIAETGDGGEVLVVAIGNRLCHWWEERPDRGGGGCDDFTRVAQSGTFGAYPGPNDELPIRVTGLVPDGVERVVTDSTPRIEAEVTDNVYVLELPAENVKATGYDENGKAVLRHSIPAREYARG